MKCNSCGRKFRLLAKNRYEIVKVEYSLVSALKGIPIGGTYFNAFDCPHCGCQNVVSVIEKVTADAFEKMIGVKRNEDSD